MSDFSVSVAIGSPRFSVSVQLQSEIITMPKIATTDPASDYEKITGAFNNSNRIFTLPHPYTTGKLAIFYNGRLETKFDEISPEDATFEMGFIPADDAIISSLYS